MIGRNIDDHFAKTPTPHYPRSRFDMKINKRLQTQGHGRLYPFFARMVYPGDTWKMDLSTFVRTDTSDKVPLDDIFLDTYFFFIPFRIIDENFPKVLGEGEPEDYDDVDYNFPTLSLDEEEEHTMDDLLYFLGYSQASATIGADSGHFFFNNDDEINPYALACYYKVYNDWFRDESVDSSIPYTDIYNASFGGIILDNPLFDEGRCLKINRFHDYFSSAMISPQKGPAVTIPLGTSAPVGVVSPSTQTVTTAATFGFSPGVSLVANEFKQGTAYSNLGAPGVVADLSNAAGTINELYLAMAIQSLYTKRATFGTRYIETIRGQWGIDVPDSFFLRPEYLGGSRVTLNNVPVLDTANVSGTSLATMSGNSSTLANGGSFTKTFIEYGMILGVSCTRVKHSYMQGKRKELFGLKTHLDLYNPVYCNIGPQPVMQSELFNKGVNNKDVVFAYQEAWAELRTDFDTFAGAFGIFGYDSELKTKWHYGDIYDPSSSPVFSASWLKEDVTNVSRTLTGRLIPGAPGMVVGTGENPEPGHQFMFGYYYHPVVTRVMSSRSQVPELFGRL